MAAEFDQAPPAVLRGASIARYRPRVSPYTTPENAASPRLHKRAGFRVAGTRERIGCHHGRWRDTVLIERRSTVAGFS